MSWTMEPPRNLEPIRINATRHPVNILVQVRETNGELTVWWPDKDQPVAVLKAYWRGPLPPSITPRRS